MSQSSFVYALSYPSVTFLPDLLHTHVLDEGSTLMAFSILKSFSVSKLFS